MSGFRKSSSRVFLAPSYPLIVMQTQPVEELKDGVISSRVVHVPVDVTSKESADSIPTYKEYYVENLVKAGIPLEQVNVSSYFDAQDSINLERVRIAALADLQSKLSNLNSEE